MKIKNTLLAVAIVSCTLFGISASQASVATTYSNSPVKAKVTLKSAKSIIRNLYYGYAQSTSWAAKKKYILAHNYPGMYSNPKGCLDKLKGWDNVTPNLSTIDFDRSWKLPKGIKSNKLSGKKPSGDTFVFTVRNGSAFNHATIKGGKAYFYWWICNEPVISPDSELVANQAFVSGATKLTGFEDDMLFRYNSVIGPNFTSVQTTYDEVDSLIPDAEYFIGQISSLEAPTATLQTLRKTWANSWQEYLQAFYLIKQGVDQNDATLFTVANTHVARAKSYMSQAVSYFSALRK